MRARNYCAHHNTRDHWTLRCLNRCPDLVVCLKRDLQCLRTEASLVLIYRPNVAGMEGRVDLAQPVNRAPDLCNPSTASRGNPSPIDRIPLVPASFATHLTYNDCNTMPSLVPDMERRSLPRFQLPVKSKRSFVTSPRI
ncbi:hypothetical protein TNCV_4679991 [Trichonephila clavipes]|nr:hypothetical protein TNCV_4679991 [Trichonephila clavipes]